MKTPILCILTASLLVTAAPAPPPPASLTTSSLAPGTPQASATDYTADTALDPSGGSLATANVYTLKPGFIGQLYDPASLAVTAQSGSINEGDTNQLSAVATMDDDTTLALAAADVSWSVVSGPLASVSAAGLAQSSPVFADTAATGRGEFASLQDDATFTVLDSLPDNFGPVAGDGIDDDWQFQFFDDDTSGSLDATEAANAAPGANLDGDPMDNTGEFLSGYDPTDASSFFTLDFVTFSGGTATLQLSKVIPGTRYRIRKSLDAGLTDPFTTIDTLTPSSETADVPVTDSSATDRNATYQVLLDKAP